MNFDSIRRGFGGEALLGSTHLCLRSSSKSEGLGGAHGTGEGSAAADQSPTAVDGVLGEGPSTAEVDEVAVVGDGTWSPPKKGPASALKKQVSSAFKFFGLGMGHG